jgi:hypothetical protein
MVLYVTWPMPDLELRQLCQFMSQRRGMPPTILVGEAPPELLQGALRVPAIALVSDAEVRERLWPEIARARANVVVADLIASLVNDGDNRLAPALRSSLLHAAQGIRVLTQVADLALLTGCHRSTLFREWKAAAASRPTWPRRLEDFVSWVLLIHAAALFRRDRSWAWVADNLGVHHQTISRIARRVAGLGTLRNLRRAGGPPIVANRCAIFRARRGAANRNKKHHLATKCRCAHCLCSVRCGPAPGMCDTPVGG